MFVISSTSGLRHARRLTEQANITGGLQKRG
uniref:Uncharacterized protein n=1 Tax=Anguilla anguilla TaxID=7936 RepID=A0A0E9XNE5_ANGAN